VEQSAPRPTEVLEAHIGYLLSKLGSLAASRFEREIAPFGLNRMQFGLLKILDAAGPSSQHVLSADLGMPPSRMVALVDDLEAQQLVARERSDTDRRVNVVRLTNRGSSLLAQVTKVSLEWEDELLRDLTSAERTQLVDLLRRVASRNLVRGPVDDPDR